MKDIQLHYDANLNLLYYVNWNVTGNNDIPTRHYLAVDVKGVFKDWTEARQKARSES